MRPGTFDFLRDFLKARSGLALGPEKAYLIETRLSRILRMHDLATLDDLVQALRVRPAAALEREVVEAMTTNETLFLRDKAAFDHLEGKLLPGLIAARAARRRITIWCAACATGQEPYSLAMLLDRRRAELAGWDIRIVATDLSTAVLERARAGVYSQFEVQRGLPVKLLLEHFTKQGDAWALSPRIKAMVDFRPINLLGDIGPLGSFDLVLCRNVLIYFDTTVRTSLLTRIARQLAPDGALLLGAAETVLGLSTPFVSTRECPGVFRHAAAVKSDFAKSA